MTESAHCNALQCIEADSVKKGSSDWCDIGSQEVIPSRPQTSYLRAGPYPSNKDIETLPLEVPNPLAVTIPWEVKMSQELPE